MEASLLALAKSIYYNIIQSLSVFGPKNGNLELVLFTKLEEVVRNFR